MRDSIVPYYYVFGTVDGKTVCLGPEESESRAYDEGLKRNFDNAMFDVKKYYTRDKSRAIQMWKYERSGETGDLRLSMKRVRHS